LNVNGFDVGLDVDGFGDIGLNGLVVVSGLEVGLRVEGVVGFLVIFLERCKKITMVFWLFSRAS
jgi:hypothetical protein